MKTDYSNMSMLDIVFENRNKQYGAYVLRKDYDKSVMKSITITTLSAFVILTANFIASRLNASVPVKEEHPTVCRLTEITPEILIPKEEVKQNTTQAKPTIKNPEMNVVADNQQHTDSVPDKDDLKKYDSGLTTNLDVQPTDMGVENGTGTNPGLEPVEHTFVVEKNDPLDFADVMPQFPGGEKKLMEYLRQMTDYPDMEQDAGIEGRAVVRFVVNEDGSVSSPNLVRNDSPGFGREALRVVKKMPNFKPGMQRGKPVKVYFVLPFQWKQQ